MANEHTSLSCEYCKETYLISSKYITYIARKNKPKRKYCSKQCSENATKTRVLLQCFNCNKNFYKLPSEVKKTKNHFCSRSCSATYNNRNKITGNKVSKLEIWISSMLKTSYPNLEIHFNKKDAIQSELDIFIPSLRMAFEINGIFHYKPIYGEEKFKQIQSNDIKKNNDCILNKIELHTIDVSSYSTFNERTAIVFLDIVQSLIDEKSLERARLELATTPL